MKILLTASALALVLASSLGSAAAPQAETAEEILKKADEIRSPSSSYRMEVTVDSSDKSHFRFEISIGGKDSSIIKTLEPSREVGKNYLMLNEDMWAFIPNIKRSVRVTLNQKLTGQAANGDISRMRWFGDYDVKLEKDKETPEEYVLFLTAQRRGLTYDKIRVWVNKKTYAPDRGEYLTQQEKVLKFVKFTEYKPMAGALRPTRIVIENANKKDENSILQIQQMEEKKFPASFFSQNSLN